MERMSKDYPSFEFKFVIGTDLLTKNNLEEWDTRPEYQNWVERTQFIILQRPGKEDIHKKKSKKSKNKVVVENQFKIVLSSNMVCNYRCTVLFVYFFQN